jgi:hypothetical protein
MREDKIKMNIKEIGWGFIDLIHLPQERDR